MQQPYLGSLISLNKPSLTEGDVSDNKTHPNLTANKHRHVVVNLAPGGDISPLATIQMLFRALAILSQPNPKPQEQPRLSRKPRDDRFSPLLALAHKKPVHVENVHKSIRFRNRHRLKRYSSSFQTFSKHIPNSGATIVVCCKNTSFWCERLFSPAQQTKLPPQASQKGTSDDSLLWPEETLSFPSYSEPSGAALVTLAEKCTILHFLRDKQALQ